MLKKEDWFSDDTYHQKYYPENPLYQHYQDDIWGIPPHNDQNIFEQYTIGIFAAGLNWNISFLKYPELTKAYHNWNFIKISAMSENEIVKMLNNPGLIRNRRKIVATISNAKLVLKLQKQYGSLDNYFWSLVDYHQERRQVDTIAELGTRSELGDKISKQMKKDGFKYAGPVSVYSFLVSIGLINVRKDGLGVENDPRQFIKDADEQAHNTFNV